jgi:hypothetical protein
LQRLDQAGRSTTRVRFWGVRHRIQSNVLSVPFPSHRYLAVLVMLLRELYMPL